MKYSLISDLHLDFGGWNWRDQPLEDVVVVAGYTILVWNHGHSHAPADKIVDGVRTICNPRGYPGENPLWKPLTIEVN